ncbi:primase-like DNA-binding domain-containing protein [Aneurinibacillus aneurinilyticus]|uniref:primase-like DNA-binding domain-containing protein n=1 Tax=Aneurinibacillus aneurinilyticus TaxID=1391 RepID=UPI0023F36A7A|nr:primase-like DNA-binding domain-containing protein [Aneurinibacillus aneurinilyticus]
MSQKQTQIQSMMKDFFNLDANEVLNTSIEEACRVEFDKYTRENEIGRAQMFAAKTYQNEYLKRSIYQFLQETNVIAGTLIMTDGANMAFNRTVLKFFSDFAGFDSGTAKALGRHFTSSLNEILEEPGAITEKGKFEHLTNLTMMKILRKSRSEFFVRIKTNIPLQESFKNKLREYCRVAWFMVMQEYGTIYDDSTIMSKVKTEQGVAKTLVRTFLAERCEIGKRESIKCIALYKAYEKWCEESEHPQLGRQNFEVELIKALPSLKRLTQLNEAKNEWVGVGLKVSLKLNNAI